MLQGRNHLIRVCALVAFSIILSFDCACPAQTPSGTHQNPAQTQDPVKAQEIGDRMTKFRESFEKSDVSEYPTLMNEMLEYAFSTQKEGPAYEEGIAIHLSYIFAYSKDWYVKKLGRPLIANDMIKILDTVKDPVQSATVLRQWGEDLYPVMEESERDMFYAYVEGCFDKEMPLDAFLAGVIHVAKSLVCYEKKMLKQDKEKVNQTEEVVAQIGKREVEIQKRAIRLAKCLESHLKLAQKQAKDKDSDIGGWLQSLYRLGVYDPEVKKIAIRNLKEACQSTTNSLELRRSCASKLLYDSPTDSNYNSAENRDFIKKLAESEKDENLRRSFQAIFENAEAKAQKVNP